MSKIEWTEKTWNPIVGCSVVSPGCTNCYAMTLAARIERMSPDLAHYKGLTQISKAGPVWTGKVALAGDDKLLEPLRRKKPTTYFVNSMSDLFHENVPDEWIDRVFAVMALAPQHTFQVPTKRAPRMRKYCGDPKTAERVAAIILKNEWQISGRQQLAPMGNRAREIDPEFVRWPLPNVWLGVSAEDQKRYDERVFELNHTPAAVRFVSAEPLLGPIETGLKRGQGFAPGIDWIIVGGESGPNARPMHPDWARSIRDQCDAGAAFFYKQHGEWKALAPGDGDWPTDTPTMIRLRPDGTKGDDGWPMQRVGKKFAGRLLDGRTHDEMPTRSA